MLPSPPVEPGTPPDVGPAPSRPRRPQVSTPTRTRALFVVWLVIAGACAWALSTGKVTISSGVDDLLPVGQRAPIDDTLIMLTVASADANDEAAGIDALLGLSSRVNERLGDEHVPLVPPAGEAAAWFDRFALWLVPRAALGELRTRLSDEAIADAVENLRARMSSPLFGTTNEDPRRDPLRLGDLTQAFAGRYGRAGAFEGAEPTASGDLVSRDGTALLLRVRSDRDAAGVLADVRDVIGSAPIEAAWVGPTHHRVAAREVTLTRGSKAAWLVLAAVTGGLAIVLRRAGAALLTAAAVGSALLAFLVVTGSADLWAIPMLALAFGAGCDAAVARAKAYDPGWTGALIGATTMVPLILLPYPGWQVWAWKWIIAAGFTTVVVAITIRAAAETKPASNAGAHLRRRPMVAVVAIAGAIVAAWWADGALRYRGADRVPLGPGGDSAAEAKLVADFFDPSDVVHLETTDVDAVAALERAGDDARALSAWVPDHATRIDSPGNLVIRVGELETRRAELAELALAERLHRLREALQSRGLRSDAFGEFLRSFDPRSGAPTAAEMLRGALGPWIRGYVTTGDGSASVRTDVYLRRDVSAPLPQTLGAEGVALEPRGPAAAARRDRSHFRDRLAIAVLGQAWIGAFILWIAARSLPIAAAGAAAALITQGATLAAIAWLQMPIGPMVLPALLAVGGAAATAAARACRTGHAVTGRGLLGAALCQVAAPAALLATDVPMWRDFGTVAMLGAAIGLGVGLFIAPTLHRFVGARRPEAA